MPASPSAIRATNSTPRWAWVIVTALLALYAGMALTASLGKGASFDEGEELAIGYDIWLHQDFRMEGANGDIVKRWATLPYLISKPAFPGTDDPNWRTANPYGLGYNFFFANGNEPELLLLQGRAMVVLLGLATGLLVFYCSREIFGDIGGLFSLSLFVFSPDMLAFGGIVSTEMSICLMLLGSTWCIWRLMHRVTWGRLFASLGFLALLFLAKATALVIFPLAAVMLTVRIISGQPLEWRLGRPKIILSRGRQAALFFALFVVHGLWCWICLWAHYDFRYLSSPNLSDPKVLAWSHIDKSPVNSTLETMISWGRHVQILPEGYLDGVESLLSSNETRETFMNGQWKVGSTPAFYPYVFWAKTPPILLVFLVLGMGWWWRMRRQNRLASPEKSALFSEINAAPPFYSAVPFVALVVVFAMVAVAQHLDIAHRHILPIYPPIDILAGGSIGLVWLLRKRWLNGLIALLTLGYAGDSATIYPNYLAYFSPSVGGSSQGYKRLVESSLDWGMDLPSLKSWLDKNNPRNRETFYFSYFGTDNPDYYGIQSTRLPSFPTWEAEGVYDLKPGIYAISATLLQGFYSQTVGPWNKAFEAGYQQRLNNLRIFNETMKDPARGPTLLKKYPMPLWNLEYRGYRNLRFARLCAWLRHHHPPDDNIGHSILIWKLNKAEIDDALYGSPAELADAPLGTPIEAGQL